MAKADPVVNTPEYLDIHEAAEHLGQTVRWMRSRVDDRSITFYKPGGVIRFKVSDLDAYMDSVRVPAVNGPPVQGRPRGSKNKKRSS